MPLPKILFIPLSPMSPWSDTELRYALRSWHKYSTIDEVLVIGHKPDWYTGSHLRYDTPHSKTEDIFRKTQYAASVHSEFIFANDDHILLSALTELPYYYQGLISEFKGGSETFMRYVGNTASLFPKGNYFDIHTPMVVTAGRMKELRYFPNTLFKSTYCYGMQGVYMRDPHLNIHMRTEQIEAFVKDKPMFAFNDNGLSPDLKKWLAAKFPVKSPWEI